MKVRDESADTAEGCDSGVLWERQKPQTRGTQYVLARKKVAVSLKSCNVVGETLKI